MRAKRYFKSMRFSLTRGFFRASLVAAGLLQCAHLAWAQAAAANAPAMAASADQVVVSGPAGQVTRAEFEQMARQIVPAQGEDTFWAVRTQVERFARNMYVQRALAVQAQQAGIALPSKLDSAPKPVRDLELTQLFMQQQVDALLADTSKLDAQARSIYRANPSQFQLPEQVRVRHILLTVADDGADSDQVKAEAKKLREQLVQGADFATLARQHSKDKANAERGGDLGLFARGRMVPAFEDAAFALNKPGELSAPVKTDFGWHLIELLERQPARQRSVDEVLPELRAKVRQQARHASATCCGRNAVQANSRARHQTMRLDRLRELKRQARRSPPPALAGPPPRRPAPPDLGPARARLPAKRPGGKRHSNIATMFPALMADCRQLWRLRALLAVMARRELATRTAGSAGGWLWVWLPPLLSVAAYFLVFDVVFQMRLGGQAPTARVGTYLIVGMLAWMAFADAVQRGMGSLLDAGGMLQKNPLPPGLFPARAVLASVLVFAPLLLLLVPMYAGAHGFGAGVLAVPLLIALQAALSFLMAYVLALLAAALRDVVQLVQVFCHWGVSVAGAVSGGVFPQAWRWLLWLNPMTGLILGYQSALLQGVAGVAGVGVGAGLAGVAGGLAVGGSGAQSRSAGGLVVNGVRIAPAADAVAAGRGGQGVPSVRLAARAPEVAADGQGAAPQPLGVEGRVAGAAARPVPGRGGPQRRRQEHAAEADYRHSATDGRPDRAPGAHHGDSGAGGGFSPGLHGAAEPVFWRQSDRHFARADGGAGAGGAGVCRDWRGDRPAGETYSSGMSVRLAFALVTLEPDLLIIDGRWRWATSTFRRSASSAFRRFATTAARSCFALTALITCAICAMWRCGWTVGGRWSWALPRRC